MVTRKSLRKFQTRISFRKERKKERKKERERERESLDASFSAGRMNLYVVQVQRKVSIELKKQSFEF